MPRPLIGQVLCRMGKLSDIDVDEILEQQARTRERFGEIAMSWGLCDPDQLCEAWVNQLAEGMERVNLNTTGIDAHAVSCVPQWLAKRIGVIPIKVIADQVVVAASRLLEGHEMIQLLEHSGKDVRVVVADRSQIEAALSTYYAPAAANAA